VRVHQETEPRAGSGSPAPAFSSARRVQNRLQGWIGQVALGRQQAFHRRLGLVTTPLDGATRRSRVRQRRVGRQTRGGTSPILLKARLVARALEHEDRQGSLSQNRSASICRTARCVPPSRAGVRSRGIHHCASGRQCGEVAESVAISSLPRAAHLRVASDGRADLGAKQKRR